MTESVLKAAIDLPSILVKSAPNIFIIACFLQATLRRPLLFCNRFLQELTAAFGSLCKTSSLSFLSSEPATFLGLWRWLLLFFNCFDDVHLFFRYSRSGIDSSLIARLVFPVWARANFLATAVHGDKQGKENSCFASKACLRKRWRPAAADPRNYH